MSSLNGGRDMDETKEEAYARGWRHGEDGIAFFPAGTQHHNHYRNGYVAGRENYREEVGRYPRTGNTTWDKKESNSGK